MSERQKSDVAKAEEAVLAFWRDNHIFKKSLNKPSPRGNFVFYDGPPFATGLPHYGHLLAGTMKDVIPRYQTMRGKKVLRRWGWDCHGLPVENLIEEELGLKSKKDILEYGVEKFNRAARESVLRYDEEWKKVIPRVGRWVDMENAYRTMDASYTESVWWSFKELHTKGLVYEGFKSMHICPRCGTTLSNFEVNQGYKDITDISVTAKFELSDPVRAHGSKEPASNGTSEVKTYLLAWTTTPWTLPGNVALAVNPNIQYVRVGIMNHELGIKEKYILAKKRLEIIKDEYEVEEEFLGKELIGKSYKPLFDYYAYNSKLENKEKGWKIYGADFVTTEDGTGIVHIAPAFGSDDYELLRKHDLPFVQHVAFDGTFKPEAKDFAGMPVKPKDDHQRADIEIIKYLAHNDLLFAKEKITHSYPHCWRCDTPLLNYATSSWFIAVTKIKDRLIAENKNVSWVPEHIGANRFGKWLEEAKDWAVSRERFWGAPLPVWKCDHCEKADVIGSVSELKEKLPKRNTFLFMRHGEAESNVLNVVSAGDFPPRHLTEKGKKITREKAKKLLGREVDYIFVSPLARTRETADIVADVIGAPKEKVVIDERIREVKTGELSGGPSRQYHNFFSSVFEKFTKTPPGGENLHQMKKRVGDFLYDIDARYEGKTILIVAHEYVAWMADAVLAGADDRAAAILRGEDDDYIENSEIRELDFRGLPHNEDFELDLHKPYIDAVSYACGACEAGVMRRVPYVFDTWYDSGSMPFAQNHYPFENKERFEKTDSPLFPADFIAEGQDQTRGWFYTLLVLGSALFKRAPYKNVIVNGVILAEDGQKMSKRLKNYPDPMELVDKYGADALRFHMMSSPAVKAEDLAFSENGVDEVMKKVILRLKNVVSFFELYKHDTNTRMTANDTNTNIHVLDRWIVARLDELVTDVTKGLENYELDRAARPIAGFVDDLSTWYLRRSRDRFKSDDEHDRMRALQTTEYVLREFSKVIAPFMPFVAEEIYQKVRPVINFEESVHLCDWPETPKVSFWQKLFGGKKRTPEVLDQMREVREIVSWGLEARAQAGIKVRQPLSLLKIRSTKSEIRNNNALIQLIKDEVNVKEVSLFEGEESRVDLDTTITPELREEGMARELIRQIQDLRKRKGLEPADTVELSVEVGEAGKALVLKFKDEISRVAGLSSISFGPTSGEPVKIDDTVFKIDIKA